ncbi:MAG TPA: adenylate/guanylate cyclase domain-containing protein [Acidimicrobiia bacterium]|nr:adenylate/guanylate cyclase domain-containing protein [Acidimicrobiia bacterium]
MSDPYAFLFTDVEGSTRLWDQSPELAARLIADQDHLIREAVEHHGGRVFASGGDGVAVVFTDVDEAVAAAIEAQRALQPRSEGSVAVRMGIHLGPVIERDNDYFGTTVNRAARVMATAHGGQVLVSEAVATRLGSRPFSLKDLGTHSLRDLAEPEHIYQVCHPELAERFPPLRSLGSYRNNLPAGLPDLIGRDRDLQVVVDVLSTRRCVTVVGPGGVGKTRFASQVAADVMDRFPGGVWMVGLAALSPSADPAGAIVASLGLESNDERSQIERVSEHIGQQATLLVLDNCEHMIDSVAAIVRGLLGSCSQLSIIATSRERLHLPEERVYDLAPLEIPEAKDESRFIATIPAVQLLIQRAEDAGALNPLQSDPRATASVCRRLDGIPLAIELAASRLRVMSIAELDTSLAASLRLLSGRDTSGPTHHATMTATIDWSYRLLDDEAQRAFARLGVFLGGFDLEAASAVGDFGSPDEVVELLTSLVEASLVRHISQTPLSRYRMLEPIRQHALVLLGAGESDIRSRHAQFFRDLALQAESHLLGVGQTEWMSRLDDDLDNLRAAQAWLAASDPAGALDLSTAMTGYWFHRAMFKEGKATLEAAISSYPDSGLRRIDALIGLSHICWIGADYERGGEAAGAALEQARAAGEEAKATIATQCLARTWLMSGRTDDAVPLMEQARKDARRLALTRWEADAAHFLGIAARQAGELERAQELHQAAGAGFEAAGDLVSVGYARGAEAVAAWLMGRIDLARKLSSESVRIHEEFGEARGAAEGRGVSAMFDLDQGDLDSGYEKATRALRELRDIGSRRSVAANLVLLARIETARGSPQTGAVLVGVAEAVYDRGVNALPPFVSAGIIPTLERDLGPEYQPALDEGRAIGWDGLDHWLKTQLEI